MSTTPVRTSPAATSARGALRLSKDASVARPVRLDAPPPAWTPSGPRHHAHRRNLWYTSRLMFLLAGMTLLSGLLAGVYAALKYL